MQVPIPKRQIRAVFSDSIVRVYQAYPSSIALPAVAAQTFFPPFNFNRMTWIKPSFFWMMYRSGWAAKSDQECILAIDICRSGFEWALRNSCLSHFDPSIHSNVQEWEELKSTAPVRVQWDPERAHNLEQLPHRTIQIGLSGRAVELYVNNWIHALTDVTSTAHQIHTAIRMQNHEELSILVPKENEYPLAPEIERIIGITSA